MVGTRFPVLRIMAAAAIGCLSQFCAAEHSYGQNHAAQAPTAPTATYESTVSPPQAAPSMHATDAYHAGASLSSVQPNSYAGMVEGDCGCGSGSACRNCGPQYADPRGCDRWYLSLSGGWEHRELVREAADPTTFIAFDDGFAINAALGYRFDLMRIEAEYSFMNNECREAGSGGLSSATVGNINLKAFMLNVYHDFEFDGMLLKPYLGAGVGIFQSEINGLFPEFFQQVGGEYATTPINATSNMPFVYQFRAGASRPLGERTEIFGGYRYFHGNEMVFSSAPFATGAAPTFNPKGAWTHGLEMGLRVRF